MNKDQLVYTVITELGYKTVDDWIASGSNYLGPYDSVAMGGCKSCGYTTNVEPDQDEGWCEECETSTVVSIHCLIGVM
tara:strand:- start:15728 stop:15961 length:234 start_codon:yes stop_codon:yes gene_type:complete